jgi:hypothetical protein
MSTDRSSTRPFVIAGLVVPAAIAAVAVALQLLWIGDVPDPAATHWSGTGAPDGFATPWTYPLLTLAFALVLPAALTAMALRGLRSAPGGPVARITAASMAAMATFIAVIATWSIETQRGLADAADAPNPWPAIFWGGVAAMAVGVAGWIAQPRHAATPRRERAGVPIDVAADERAVWIGTATASPWLVGIVGGSAVLLTAIGIVVLLGAGSSGWPLLLVGVAMAVVFATTAVFRVRVDRDGVVARAAIGWPRFTVPIDDVAAASVGDVNGFAEFGGWGIRKAPGAFGIVLHDGDALSVERRDGRRFVVTVDTDADTAAGLLQAFVDRPSVGRGC